MFFLLFSIISCLTCQFIDEENTDPGSIQLDAWKTIFWKVGGPAVNSKSKHSFALILTLYEHFFPEIFFFFYEIWNKNKTPEWVKKEREKGGGRETWMINAEQINAQLQWVKIIGKW